MRPAVVGGFMAERRIVHRGSCRATAARVVVVYHYKVPTGIYPSYTVQNTVRHDLSVIATAFWYPCTFYA